MSEEFLLGLWGMFIMGQFDRAVVSLSSSVSVMSFSVMSFNLLNPSPFYSPTPDRWDIQRIREQRIFQRLQQRMNKKKATPEPESHLQSFYPEAEDGTAPQAIIVLSRLNSRVNSEFLFFLLTLFFLPFS